MAGIGGKSGPGDWGPEEKEAAKKQRVRIWKIMCDWNWHTLAELEKITNDPQPSISARIRDFRKRKFGGHDYRIVQPADSHDPA
jgi:hypothetical protein